MTDVEAHLEARARQAYEAGRILAGARRAALVAPMAALSILACGHPLATLLDAAALASLVGLFHWRGGAFARGGGLGLWAGVPSLLMPQLVVLVGHVCGSSFCLVYPGTCLAGGAVSGVLLGWWGLGAGLNRQAWLAAGLVAALAGALGCLLAGTVGLIGLGTGLLLGAGPVFALRRV
jgi:hypothetical protein